MAAANTIRKPARKKQSAYRGPTVKGNSTCDRDQEINILLLGQTGVGKSTFINAFANYIVNNTLMEAVNDEMQVIIPSSFSYTDRDQFEEQMIVIGEENKYEQFKDVGQSNTQQCRSFVFPIGDRNLRFIDTPGVGDTRGFDQDAKNFQEIMTYIAQYEHLNGVFILLKPNEERLTVLFRFSVNELLRHLHVAAKDNIVFVFTNARSTFFSPGSTKKILQKLLDDHRAKHQVEVPFSKDNTFLFDNEAFRFLALRQNGIELDDDQTKSYTQSWNYSVEEYSRLMKHINSCGLHAISNTLSLNEAEQLIRKLPRPLAETARFIEENIQLAKEFKKKVLEDPQIAAQGIPQNNAVVKRLTYPQTVCTSKKCCRVTEMGKEKKVEYLSICHPECYLTGVDQEKLKAPELLDCEAIDADAEICLVCGCSWELHKHITYECDRQRTYAKIHSASGNDAKKPSSLSDIDKRISALREEEKKIQDVYIQLARFLHAKSLLPINDGYVDYLEYFIREERMKQSAGADNTELIAKLEDLITDYKRHMALFEKTLKERRDPGKEADVIPHEKVFELVATLYYLPINGQQIRDQVNGIKISQGRSTADRETFVELPAKAASSKVMKELTKIVCKQSTR